MAEALGSMHVHLLDFKTLLSGVGGGINLGGLGLRRGICHLDVGHGCCRSVRGEHNGTDDMRGGG